IRNKKKAEHFQYRLPAIAGYDIILTELLKRLNEQAIDDNSELPAILGIERVYASDAVL
ncbi:hypothetical protein BgiBS90_018422, partial [Biomphalaria glabrata]